MKVFTGVELKRLEGALEILDESERIHKLRRKIKETSDLQSGVDLEDLGILKESISNAKDAINGVLIVSAVYMKDERVDKLLDERNKDVD